MGIAIFCAFQIVDSLLENPDKPYFNKRYVPCKPLMGPALYFCTMIFNVAITFYIGEYLLGLISLSILGFLLCTVCFRLVKSSNAITGESIDISFLLNKVEEKSLD